MRASQSPANLTRVSSFRAANSHKSCATTKDECIPLIENTVAIALPHLVDSSMACTIHIALCVITFRFTVRSSAAIAMQLHWVSRECSHLHYGHEYCTLRIQLYMHTICVLTTPTKRAAISLYLFSNLYFPILPSFSFKKCIATAIFFWQRARTRFHAHPDTLPHELCRAGQK